MMSLQQETPWSQYEKTELLAEIIKSCNVPPENLIHFLRTQGISQPSWGDVVPPKGRTLNQCAAVFSTMIGAPQPSFFAGPASIRESGPATGYKRPFSVDLTSYGGRRIQPRPSSSVHESAPAESSEPPKKKRGRPTKAEAARRHEATIARSQFAPLSNFPLAPAGPGPSTAVIAAQFALAGQPALSTQGASAAQPVRSSRTPQPPPPASDAGTSDTTSSGRKRRGRPPKIEVDDRRPDIGIGPSSAFTPSRYPDILRREDSPEGRPGPSTRPRPQ